MLHPLAQDGILRITAGFDRQTLADFFVVFHDRIAELNAVASRVRRRQLAQDDVDRLDLPLIVGRAVLRRPSVAAREWLAECASKWWGRSTRAYTFALAFVCAHRDEKAYEALRSRWRASTACWAWVLGVLASEEALRRAAISLLPPPEGSLRWFSDPDDALSIDLAKPDLLAIATRLSREFGGTTGHWLWEVAEEEFWGAACDLADEADAKADTASIEAGQGHADGSWWRIHRRALVRCETALETDVQAWLKRRTEHRDA